MEEIWFYNYFHYSSFLKCEYEHQNSFNTRNQNVPAVALQHQNKATLDKCCKIKETEPENFRGTKLASGFLIIVFGFLFLKGV